MFFDVKLLGIRQNGRFSKCWLAATNPKAFRAYVKRNDLEKICVTTVCDDILQEFNKSMMNTKRRIPLYLAAQLVFGTVCIYQQQVHFLYEKTNHLLCSHVVILKDLKGFRIKRSSEHDHETTVKRKKRKLTKSKNVGDLEKDFQESVLEDDQGLKIDLIPLDPNAGNPHEFIIREVNWDGIGGGDEPEMFGEMTVQEKQEFLDLIAGKTTMAQLCQEKEVEKETGQILATCVDKISEVKIPPEISERKRPKVVKQKQAKKSVNKDATLDEDSIPIIREEPQNCIEARTSPLIINEPPCDKTTTPTRDVHVVNTNETLCSRNNETLMPNDILPPQDISQLPEMQVNAPENDITNQTLNCPRLEELDPNSNGNAELHHPESSEIQNIEHENLVENNTNLDNHLNALVAEMYRPKNKKKKLNLKIDAHTEISYKAFLKQFDCNDTKRCQMAIDDIVPYYKLAYKPSEKLLALPCLMKNSVPLMTTFKKSLVSKSVEIDTNVFEDILDIPVTEMSEIFPAIFSKKNAKIFRVNSVEKSNQNCHPVETNVASFNAHPVETNVVPFNAEIEQNLPEIEPALPPFPINEVIEDPIVPELCQREEDILPLDLQNDLLENFRVDENQNQTTAKEAFNRHRENTRPDWDKKEILRKLLHLWRRKVEPIDMSIICKGASRKDAAYAFYTIIELTTHKYLTLTKNNDTNEIYHIAMGERLIER